MNRKWTMIGMLRILMITVLVGLTGCSSGSGGSTEAQPQRASQDATAADADSVDRPATQATPPETNLAAAESEPAPEPLSEPRAQRLPTTDPDAAPALPPPRTGERKPSPDPLDHGDTWFANEVPAYPMGKPKARSLPPRKDDPEWESVITGKRKVAIHDLELHEGWASPDAMAERILELIEARDREGLRKLCIDREEFTTIFWPEFPTSRPATNWTAEEAWFFHAAKVESGISEALDHGGRELVLDAVTCELGHAPYTNFDLYHGIKIYAHEASGEQVMFDFVKTLALCKGQWKIYICDD